jgi:nucleotide-binding universal stress UspA family protein
MAALPLLLPESDVRPQVRDHLQRIAKRFSIQPTRKMIHSLAGHPVEEICHLAREEEIDLIVMSTRGNTGWKHLALGSTAEHVVRYSPCPVLVMHPVNGKTNGHGHRRVARSKPTFERILVPIDFSECSLEGLEYAKAMAKQFGSKLILLNSVALQYYITSDEYARYDLPQLMKRSEKSARDQMRDLMEKTDWDGIEVSSLLEIGHAGQQICEGAAEEKADLIITSTHGTTGFKHLLMGSTAEYIIRHSRCPVLVVPSHDRPGLK